MPSDRKESSSSFEGLPDFNAQKHMTAMRLTELTLFDEEQRVAILEMVKDGSLSIEEAVAEVKSTQPKVHHAKYLGSFVSALHQASPDTRYDETMKAAATYLKKAKATKVKLIASTIGIRVLSLDADDQIENESMTKIVHFGPVPGNSKVFGFITASTRLGVCFTFLFQVAKPKEATDILATIDERHKMGAPAVVKDGDKQDDDDFVEETYTGAHAVTYLGCADVANSRGDEIVQGAVAAIRAVMKGSSASSTGGRRNSRSTKPVAEEDVASVIAEDLPAMIVISSDGIKIVDINAREVINNTIVSSISYQQPLLGKKAEMYTFIEVDDRRSAFICHVFLCSKGIKKQSHAIFDDVQNAIDIAHKSGGNPFRPSATQEPEEYVGVLSDMQMPRRNLEAIKAIGNGQFGKVYLAKGRDADDENEDDVNLFAVKMLRKNAVNDDSKEFLREAETMMEIGSHEMLVSLLGVVLKRKPWLLILEYCQYGDLSDVLKACRKKKIGIRLSEQLYVAEQIASGMQFITSKNYVHMDLACRNVLLHHGSRVRIADFGLTHKYDEGKSYYKQRGVMKLSIRWLAIDSYDHKIFSEKSDMWSFGITFWEILTGSRQPYHGNKLKEVLVIVRKGTRLEQPKHCPDELWELIASCWHPEPIHRPTFRQMQEKLHKVKESLESAKREVRDIGKLLNKDLTENIKRITFKRKGSKRASDTNMNLGELTGIIEDENENEEAN